MKRTQHVLSLAFWAILISALTLQSCFSTETDEQLIARMNAGVETGDFLDKPEALSSVSKLLSRGNPEVNDTEVIDSLITTGALLLTDEAEWTDYGQARNVYELIKRFDSDLVTEGLVRKVVHDTENRLHVLFLGVRLGIDGSQERLNQVLIEHGDKQMAEDFINSGSQQLYDGGKQWADNNGYYIAQGPGSHRMEWGQFS